MKKTEKAWLVRLLCVALSLLCMLPLASCDLAQMLPPGMLGGTGGGGAGEGEPFAPNEIPEVTKTVFEGSYRDQLNENEKAIYDAVAGAAAGEYAFTVTLAEEIALCKGRVPTEQEKDATSSRISFWITNALYAVWLDCPRLFWMETGNYEYSYSIVPDKKGIYRVKSIELAVEARDCAANAALYAGRLDTTLAALSLETESDYETVLAINDYLCSRITYDLYAKERESVYGALVDGKCVCEGYAHAFKLLCDRFGVVCATIIGTGYTAEGSEGHVWNAVLLDGKWYAVDVTWNDYDSWGMNNRYLLVGSKTAVFFEHFDESHVAEYARGESKVFASPKLNEIAYNPER